MLIHVGILPDSIFHASSRLQYYLNAETKSTINTLFTYTCPTSIVFLCMHCDDIVYNILCMVMIPYTYDVKLIMVYSVVLFVIGSSLLW